MKIAITGHEGTIGSRLVKRGYTPLECNITNFEAVRDTVANVNPDVIIHCAAMTSVAECEKNEKEAFMVNVRGTSFFDYSEKQIPNTVNAYGLTKLSGEKVTTLWDNPYTIIRISRTFDFRFLESSLLKMKENIDLDFPTFIKRSFVHADHLADGIAYVAENDLNVDLLNVSGTHTLSYYDFWIQVAKTFGIGEKRIKPRKHEIEDYPRPFRGGLNVKKAKKLGVPLYSANDGLKLIKEKM
jgi:dTDP-4-dehydrorhamnose reductase